MQPAVGSQTGAVMIHAGPSAVLACVRLCLFLPFFVTLLISARASTRHVTCSPNRPSDEHASELHHTNLFGCRSTVSSAQTTPTVSSAQTTPTVSSYLLGCQLGTDYTNLLGCQLVPARLSARHRLYQLSARHRLHELSARTCSAVSSYLLDCQLGRPRRELPAPRLAGHRQQQSARLSASSARQASMQSFSRAIGSAQTQHICSSGQQHSPAVAAWSGNKLIGYLRG